MTKYLSALIALSTACTFACNRADSAEPHALATPDAQRAAARERLKLEDDSALYVAIARRRLR